MRQISKSLILLVIWLAGVSSLSAQTYTTLSTLAHISDYGCEGDSALAVSSLVKGWNPSVILTSGDNHYGGARDFPACPTNTMDDDVGRYYADYIYPYNTYTDYQGTTLGAQNVNSNYRNSSAPPYNRFYPVPGNHDYDGEIIIWESYFKQKEVNQHPAISMKNSSNSSRYYDFTYNIGQGDSIHFFALNTVEPKYVDGCPGAYPHCDSVNYDLLAQQHQWLLHEASNSTALFKIVYLHTSPHSSDPGARGTALTLSKWNWAEMGIDAVIAGDDHYYERNWKDGVLYLVNGLGGFPDAKLLKPSLLVSGNAVHYDEAKGAIKLDVIQWNESNKKDLKFSFYNTKNGGTVIDSIFLRPQVSAELEILSSGNSVATFAGLFSNDFSDEAIGYVNRDYGHSGSPNASLRFTGQGHITFPNAQSVINELFDPSGAGYTVSFWYHTSSVAASQHDVPIIKWYQSGAQTDLASINQRGSKMVLGRYIDYSHPARGWQMSLWNPEVFEQGWQKVVYAVKEDIVRIKVYREGEGSAQWGEFGYGGNTELLYMGGQDLSMCNEFGFGYAHRMDLIWKVEGFKVYDRALSYKQMDKLRLEEIAEENAQARIADKEEEIGSMGQTTPSGLYPNPGYDFVTVQLLAAQSGEVRMEVVNLSGATLYTQTYLLEKGANAITCDMQSLARGFYMVRFSGPDTQETFKFLKQ